MHAIKLYKYYFLTVTESSMFQIYVKFSVVKDIFSASVTLMHVVQDQYIFLI